MNFSEALMALRKGHKICREAWARDNTYLKIDGDKVIGCTLATSTYNWDNDILLTNDWLIDDDIVMFSFDKAIDGLLAGKKVKLSNWSDQHLELDRNTRSIVLKHYVPFNMSIGFDSFLATDWIIIENKYDTDWTVIKNSLITNG